MPRLSAACGKTTPFTPCSASNRKGGRILGLLLTASIIAVTASSITMATIAKMSNNLASFPSSSQSSAAPLPSSSLSSPSPSVVPPLLSQPPLALVSLGTAYAKAGNEVEQHVNNDVGGSTGEDGNEGKAVSVAAVATTTTITYVLLLNPDCNDDMRDRFDYYMRLNNTAYERYLGYYEVVCMGGVSNLADIEKRTLPMLRSAFPDDLFVFVYPEAMKNQYSDYLVEKYGYQYRYAALGNSDITKGIAFADEFPATIKHEMGHLATCGTWHGTQGEELGYIIRHPLADNLAWCNKG